MQRRLNRSKNGWPVNCLSLGPTALGGGEPFALGRGDRAADPCQAHCVSFAAVLRLQERSSASPSIYSMGRKRTVVVRRGGLLRQAAGLKPWVHY